MAGLQDYKRLQKLGVGSFASAHLMQHKVTGKKSVLKRIACKHLKAANAALLEVKVLLSCNHVNITAYHDFFLDSDSEENIVICLFMEYCSGGDLWERIAAAQRERKVLPAAQSAGWLLQIIAALRYLHSCGIMHRDVKPENIFITEEARTELRAALAQCTTAYAHITHLEWAWHALRTCMTRTSHVHGAYTVRARSVLGVCPACPSTASMPRFVTQRRTWSSRWATLAWPRTGPRAPRTRRRSAAPPTTWRPRSSRGAPTRRPRTSSPWARCSTRSLTLP